MLPLPFGQACSKDGRHIDLGPHVLHHSWRFWRTYCEIAIFLKFLLLFVIFELKFGRFLPLLFKFDVGRFCALSDFSHLSLNHLLVGHSNRTSSISSPFDGSCIVSSSFDQKIRVWSVKQLSGYKNEVNTYLTGLSSLTRDFSSSTWARKYCSKVEESFSWPVSEDRWVRDDKNELLIWVPLEYRPLIYRK